MRSASVLCSGILIVLTTVAVAQVANETSTTNRSLSLTTVDGRLFKSVRITRREAGAIGITHSTGICTLKHTELSRESLKALGLQPVALVVTTPMRAIEPPSNVDGAKQQPLVTEGLQARNESEVITNQNTTLRQERPTKVVAKMCQACVCPQCKGEGRSACATCKGVGRVSCDTCKGAKVVASSVQEMCAKCGGRGQIQVPTYSSVSGGAGKRNTKYVSGYNNEMCVVCRGRGSFDKTGSQQCGQCFGQGTSTCRICSGAKGKRCNICDGQGRIRSCKVCRGTGVVQEET